MKHLKSSLRDLRQLFDRDVSARYLAEPLISFDGPRLASDVKPIMDDRDFDVVGVRRDGVIAGFVAREDLLVGTLEEHVRTFDAADVLDEATSLASVVRRLVESPRVWLTILGETSGIITKGDLQKAPVRMWLFGITSLLEMQLLRLIRTWYPDESWKNLLSAGRVQKAEEILQDRRRRNEAIDLADCLQFADKRRIVAKTASLRSALGFRSEGEADEELQRLQQLRDELAHAQDIVSGRWPELGRIAQVAEQILARSEAAG
jgi:hypothetical protein